VLSVRTAIHRIDATKLITENWGTTLGRIGFLFHLGHGHYAQYLNFQECLTPEQAERSEWFTLQGETSGDAIAKLSFLPWRYRYGRNQVWHANRAIGTHRDWDALFLACRQMGLVSMLKRYRTYHYADMSPSLEQELAPWYDRHMPKSQMQRQLKELVIKRFYAALSGMFTMSEWARQGFHRDYDIPLDRIHVSLPGANLNRFHFVNRAQRTTETPVRVLMVGSEFRRKGGEMILSWAERTQARNWAMDIVTWTGELPDWVRECLGNPGNDARISQTLAPRLPNVRVHCGIQANTPEAMQLFTDADIFCLPTQADGSSIASLEAMATGLPVLVGAVGGIPELIKDGETGFLLQRGDANDLECKLERLIADRDMRLAVGAAARQSCEDQFNVTRQVNDIFAVLDRDRARPRRMR
jgi:glycosyltransferase involved in cell wall biosynthesis